MRARNIKPGFFENDYLAEVDPMGRLLFIGLWLVADREGRLVDNPRRIRGDLLRYDDLSIDDVDGLLDELHKRQFIIRYEVDGQRFIEVCNFTKHQNPHMKEAPSTIPAPDKHSTSTIPAPDKHSENPAESLLLNPESLNPESLNPESVSSVNGIAVDTVKPSDAVAGATGGAARVLHSHGIGCQPSDPRVRELVRQGVGLDVLDAACREARAKKPGERVPLGYVLKVIESWARDADGMKVNGARKPRSRLSFAEQWAEVDRKRAEQERVVEGNVMEVVDERITS